MLNAHDLDALGKQIADEYIQNETALTESLTKTARNHGLNRQQINRVAESANEETYLNLIKEADDKYVVFDLADSSIAHDDTVASEKTASFTNDYSVTGTITTLPGEIYGWEIKEDLEKTAEEDINTTVVTKEAQRLEGTLQLLEDALFETKAAFEQHYGNTQEFVKQAVLSGVPFEDTAKVLVDAAPAIAEPISTMLKEALSERIPHFDFDLESQEDGLINIDSDLYKQAQCLGYYADRFGALDHAIDIYYDEYKEVNEKIERPQMYKRAGLITSTLVNLGTLARKHKALTGTLAVLPVAYRAGKLKGESEQGQLLQEALVKAGPQRNLKKVFR